LRDGASAQYGSDAIAGVLNLNLKKEKGLSAQVSYGANITPKANDHRGDYDGEQGQLDLNYGTDLGKKGGFINLTFSAQFRNPTFRAGTFDGTIFNAYNAIEQRALEAGDNLSNYFSNSNVNAAPQLLGLIKNYAGEVNYFNSSFLSQIQNATSLTSLRSILSKDVTDDELAYRQLTRKDFNMHVGQSRLRGTQFFLNTELPISDSWKFYAFGGQSYRYGEAGGFFRRPNQARTFTGLHPNGYLPWITTDIQDSSISAGFKGEAGAWHIDVSNTFGRNEFAYTIKHTGNTSLRFASPSSFDAGKLSFLQNTLNLDFSRALNLFEKANLSLGAEQRHEAYSIVAGDESSYATYDLSGRVQDGNTPNNQKPTDFFGAYLPGGAQVFSGLREESALTKTRNVWAGYAEFETVPVASASVAQVHRARLFSGEAVAVKVLRPDIRPVIEQDLALLRFCAGWVERLFADGKRLRPREVVDEFDKYLHDELDLMREAANCSQLGRNFKDSAMLTVPKVFYDYCAREVLTIEWMDGTPVSDTAALKAQGTDLHKLAEYGVEIFFTQVFRDGFFHADMHPGNILVAPGNRYIALDFGIVGSLTDYDKRYLAINFLAFFNRDYHRVATAHIESGWVPPDTRAEELEAAVRAVCEPVFNKPISQISFGLVLMRLFEVSRRFHVEIQPQLVLLQKTLLNIEGLGRQLDPDLDLWATAKPFLVKWMHAQVGPKALWRNLKNEAPDWAEILPALPRKIAALVDENRQQEMRDAYVRLVKIQQRQSLWLAVIALALVLILLFK